MANIAQIKRFAVHDGDGIRTTVFFKGCSLKCVWCHNPETIYAKKQLAFYSHKCIMCKECAHVCTCHVFSDGVHTIDRDRCNFCAACADVCPQNALNVFGESMSADEICKILLKDAEFYLQSNGGITLSGGECLLQPEACREILNTMKKNNIHTAVDTCGYVLRENIDAVMPYTDIFLYDIKAADADVHIKCTGHSNEIILDNLKYIDECGCKTEIRIPYVPGYNDNQIPKIAEILKGLKNITGVRVLPYHNYAQSKYIALNMENTLPENLPTDADIEHAENILRDNFLL